MNVLHIQYSKVRPDTLVLKDRMQRTFAWRRREIRDGMTVEDVLKKYPFLKTPSGVSVITDFKSVLILKEMLNVNINQTVC